MMYEVKVAGQTFKFHGSASEAGEYAKRKAAALRIPMERLWSRSPGKATG